MTLDEVKRQLTSAAYRVVKEERLPKTETWLGQAFDLCDSP